MESAKSIVPAEPAGQGGGHIPRRSIDGSKTQPRDFEGEVSTNDEMPSAETIAKIDNYLVLDRCGKSRPFRKLYRGGCAMRRTLFIFIRHFYCGNCQEYLRTVSESITPEALATIPVSTSIVVIGCGDPALIDMYAETTKWPYEMYTDPSGSLFNELGMMKTLALGSRPVYMKKSMVMSTIHSIGQALRAIPGGMVLKSGDQRQVGGEFLFEPLTMAAPAHTPRDMPSLAPDLEESEEKKEKKMDDDGDQDEEPDKYAEEKRLTWCHRMRTTRDHAEIPELMEVLGLEGHGEPIPDEERWSEALSSRKGTGSTMAPQIKELRRALAEQRVAREETEREGGVEESKKGGQV
ncbi:hypothetical protein E4U21_001754 [Claviceps maximensis]|nr:hypothetical protein E4U21_001754 [Claviceps maximensis]